MMRNLAWKGALGRRLLLQLLLLSGCLTLISTVVVLVNDYRHEFGLRDNAVRQINDAYLPSLAQSLWKYDDQQIRAQLEGLLNFPYVTYVVLQDAGGQTFSAGEPVTDSPPDEYRFPITFSRPGYSADIGSLYLQTDTSRIWEQVLSMTLLILGAQFLKALIISAVALWLVSRLITRHLQKLAVWADKAALDEPPVLERDPADDELERISLALKRMQGQIRKALEQRDSAMQELETLNVGLEKKIELRTLELSGAISDLNGLVDELRSTQKRLVEAEKMAQMGSLVAGVAHELNTPLGICVTARSYIEDSVTLIRQRMQEGTLDRQKFSELINSIADGLMMIDENLNRSHRLVRTFKSLAVDQSSDRPSEFALQGLLQDAGGDGNSFDIDGALCTISSDVSGSPTAITCRNTLHTVLGALIGNSLDHGYPRGGDVQIRLSATADAKLNRLLIDYRDDGCGLTPDVKERIFDPFFTTGRKRGKTGLGMHLVYNLVSQVLMGDIEVVDSERGIHLRLDIPLDLPRFVREGHRRLRLVATSA
ncbi:ATP-binding protein [Thalassolituus sp. LLYu03]|uniref:sensor histidine kinase n=1 Tax=Thalassolituus sp. LLYu03 TaxID=3421656 RepID=UPI003D2D3A4E